MGVMHLVIAAGGLAVALLPSKACCAFVVRPARASMLALWAMRGSRSSEAHEKATDRREPQRQSADVPLRALTPV